MSQNNDPSRRRFLVASLAGASTACLASAPSAVRAETGPSEGAIRTAKARYDELLPHEFRKRLAERPIAYLPLGTLERHAEHMPLGSDAILSEGLMLECARQLGGIVMPPIHLAPSQTPLKYAEVMASPQPPDGNCYWVSMGFHLLMVDAILAQLKRAGFRAVFADGHGPSRRAWTANIAERETRLELKLFGVTPEITAQWKSQMDHAGRNETSLMMHFRPELVDLSQLPPYGTKKPEGYSGQDPRDATAEYGGECLTKSVELVRQLFAAGGPALTHAPETAFATRRRALSRASSRRISFRPTGLP